MADDVPRLFACGRSLHGELGLGNPKNFEAKRTDETEEVNDFSTGFATNGTDASSNKAKEGGRQDLDDELFGMLNGDKAPPPSSRRGDEKAQGGTKQVQGSSSAVDIIGQSLRAGRASTPIQLPVTPKEIVHICSGLYHNAMIGAKNTVHTWGADLSGQCGHGKAENQWKPKWMMSISGKSVMDVACGRTHTLLVAAGQVYSWGASGYGALGHSDHNFDQLNPTKIRAIRRLAVKQVAAGCDHSLALSNSGDVYAWGRVQNGRLGMTFPREQSFEYVPRRISTFSGKVAAVVAGHHHSLCVMENGTLYSWGCNESGQLGTGDLSSRFTPYQVQLPKPHQTFEKMAVVEVSAGARHSCAVVMWFNVMQGEMRTQVFSWGWNGYGQLGASTPEKDSVSASPLRVALFDEFSQNPGAQIKKASAVQCGGHHTLVVADGVAYSFGCNTYGQLGLGDFKHRSSPHPIHSLSKHYVASSCCGAWHTLLLTGERPIGTKNQWIPFAPPIASGDTKAGAKGRQVETGAAEIHPPMKPIVPRQPRKSQGLLSSLLSGGLGGLTMCTGGRKGASKPNVRKPKPPAGYPPRR